MKSSNEKLIKTLLHLSILILEATTYKELSNIKKQVEIVVKVIFY